MKKKDVLAEVAMLVDHYRDRLGVDPRTKINIMWVPELDAYAKIEQYMRRRIADLSVGRSYTELDWRDRCQTIVHEMLHASQHGPHTLVSEMAGAHEIGDFMVAYYQQHELFTDTLAEALVDQIPMPEEPAR